jgi:hypothetical protein
VKITEKSTMLKTILTTTVFAGAIAFCHNTFTAYAAPTDSVSSLIAQALAIHNRGRIQFQPGATKASITSYLEDGIDRYTFEAYAGQPASVNISSPAQKVFLTIIDPYGTPIARYQNGVTNWSGTLRASGIYTIEAVAPGITSQYKLSLSIEPLDP